MGRFSATCTIACFIAALTIGVVAEPASGLSSSSSSNIQYLASPSPSPSPLYHSIRINSAILVSAHTEFADAMRGVRQSTSDKVDSLVGLLVADLKHPTDGTRETKLVFPTASPAEVAVFRTVGLAGAINQIKAALDKAGDKTGDVSQQLQFELQMAMDAYTKSQATMSNILKSSQQTTNDIAKNFK